MSLSNLPLEDLAIWGYSFVGTLFLFYCFIVFIQVRINNKVRLALSLLFLTIGLFFFNAAGKILTGHGYEFTIIALVNALLLAGIGLICTYIIYKESRKELISDTKEEA